jgi:RNA polymerase sigma factor (sigma-70 family)
VEAAEYEEFFRRAYPMLTRYAQRRFAPDLAEELAATTLLKVWTKNLATPRDDGQWRALHAFAYRILDGYMKNAARSEAARSGALERAWRDLDVGIVPDVSDDVLSASWPEWVEPLPLTDRDLLELVVDGYKVAEIALILGCTSAAVSMRLQRARKRAVLLWRKEVERGRPRVRR